MKLTECRLGEVVISIHPKTKDKVGHIVGLALSKHYAETVPLIRFAGETKDLPIHTDNLNILT